MSNIIDLELNNSIDKNNKTNLVTKEEQKTFLETTLGKVVNEGVNLGLKAILPDFIEDELIEIKDSIITDGFKSGVQTAIDNAMDFGKSIKGIFTGKFENVSQVKEVIKSGGLMDTVSDLLDSGISFAKNKKIINSNVANLIKTGKKTLLNTVENNLENNLTNQIESIEKIDNYISNWSKYYANKDFSNMEKQYNKIEKELEKVIPLENTLVKARQLENIHNLIKNNGNNFNLTVDERELAEMLV